MRSAVRIIVLIGISLGVGYYIHELPEPLPLVVGQRLRVEVDRRARAGDAAGAFELDQHLPALRRSAHYDLAL